MNQKAFFLMAVTLVTAVVAVRADVIETKNGARLVGKITKIDGSTVTLTTDYAGTLSIKQAEVVKLQTDGPLFVRLTDGTVMLGTAIPAEAGKIRIEKSDGIVTASVYKIAAIWAPREMDPAILALQRKWSYEASVDVTGKSGNSEQLGTAFSLNAVLTGPHDKLRLYTAYNRQRTDGQISADQFKAGIDYSDNFSGRNSWYVRDEGGFDHVKDISFYNTSAAGLGHDFIKKPKHELTGRLGLAFRYENYKNPATSDVQDAGLDIGLHHEYKFYKAKLVNNLTYMPLFNDFTNYTIGHESYYEVPLMASKWKLRIGISHDYVSKPGAGVDRLDTTYFTRLVLDWE